MERKDRGEEWIITAAGGSGEQDERERWASRRRASTDWTTLFCPDGRVG